MKAIRVKYLLVTLFSIAIAFQASSQNDAEINLVLHHLRSQPKFSGIIGEDNATITFVFTKIEPDPSGEKNILVFGRTQVKDVIVDFDGIFEFNTDLEHPNHPHGTFTFIEVDDGRNHIGSLQGIWNLGPPIVGGADCSSLRGHTLLGQGYWIMQDESLKLPLRWDSTILTTLQD